MKLQRHRTEQDLKRILPEAKVYGGSFSEFLSNKTGKEEEIEPDEIRRAKEEASNIVVGELLLNVGCGDTTPLKRGPRGKRIWPHGYTGSITNKRTVVLGAIIEDKQAPAIGIDLELDEKGSEMLRYTVNESELPPTVAQKLSIVAGFSVKEAAYKAFYNLEKRTIDFDDIRLHWKQDENSYSRGIAECPSSIFLDIRCTSLDDWVLSVALATRDMPEVRV